MTKTANPLPKPLRQGGSVAAIRERVWTAAGAAFSPRELEFDRTTGACHCGAHSARFPRCKFSAPRHLADVFWNFEKTGRVSAGRFAAVSASVDHFADDIVVSLGCGVGSCIAGWEYHRGAQIQRLIGVEVEPLSRRVVRAIFPSIELVEQLDSVDLPTSGRLVVLSGLVMNLINAATAARWGEIVARHPGPVVWADVGRENDRNMLPNAFAALRAAGRVPEGVSLSHQIDAFDPSYRTSLTVWA